MKTTLSHLLAASAAIGLAVAPIAAQANTRAGDSAPIYAMQGLPFVDVDDDDDEEGGWLRFVLFGGLLIGALGGVLIVVGDGDDQSPPNNQSPGAN